MFEWLSDYRQIFCVGPPRSGSTICAKMIAHDLDRPFVDADLDRRYTIQDFHVIHDLGARAFDYAAGARAEQVALVVTLRDIREAQESWARACKGGHPFPPGQERHPRDLLPELVMARAVATGADVVTIPYRALKTHTLWVDDRSGWHPKQTQRA